AARELPSKITFRLAAGDVVSIRTPGGGGTESPLERAPERVAADGALGKISVGSARTVYGVVVDPRTHALDPSATRDARARMRRCRPGVSASTSAALSRARRARM